MSRNGCEEAVVVSARASTRFEKLQGLSKTDPFCIMYARWLTVDAVMLVACRVRLCIIIILLSACIEVFKCLRMIHGRLVCACVSLCSALAAHVTWLDVTRDAPALNWWRWTGCLHSSITMVAINAHRFYGSCSSVFIVAFLCARAGCVCVCVCVCRVLVCNVDGTDPPDLTDSKQISKIFVTTWGHFSWGGWESASFHPKDSVWIYHDKRKGKDHNTMRYDKRNLTWPEWGLL